MTRSSDLVMVEREPTEAMLNAARDWSIAKHGIGIGNDAAVGCWRAMIAAALQSVEGGVRVAAKQESCPESAPRSETAIVPARRECRCDNPMVKCDHTGIRCTMCGELARIDAAVSGVTNSAPANRASHNSGERDPVVMPDCPGADTQLTKSPSAGHDAGNLRGLAEPNHHQPHALSQGWRDDMENAPKDRPVFLLSIQPQEAGGFYITGDAAQWCEASRCFVHGLGFKSGIGNAVATHWRELSELGLPI